MYHSNKNENSHQNTEVLQTKFTIHLFKVYKPNEEEENKTVDIGRKSSERISYEN